MDKKTKRLRRARRVRSAIRRQGAVRLTIHRTPRHIYAQLIKPNGSEILSSASTLDNEVKAMFSGSSGNAKSAAIVGKMIAKRALAAGIQKVAFDRAGFKYHGRVKALADAAREEGLQF